MSNHEDSFLSLTKVATRLSVSTRTIRNWMRLKKPIPFYRLAGRTVRFKWPEVEAWVTKERSTMSTLCTADIEAVATEAVRLLHEK